MVLGGPPPGPKNIRKSVFPPFVDFAEGAIWREKLECKFNVHVVQCDARTIIRVT